MSIAIEVAELMERFQWLAPDEVQADVKDCAQRAAVADKLADVAIYCLSLPAALRLRRVLVCASRPGSSALDLDVSTAVFGRPQINEHRYPADKFQGRFRRLYP